MLLRVSPAPRFDRLHVFNIDFTGLYDTMRLLRPVFALIILIRPCYTLAADAFSLELVLDVEAQWQRGPRQW